MPRALILLTSLVRSRQRIAFALIGLAACVAASANAQTAHLSSATTQNFGSINIGTPSSPATLTFTFDTAGVLGSTSVVTQGATGLDFADAGTGSCKAGTSYAASSTCTINVILTAKYPGGRYGAAMLNNNSGEPIATAYLQGTGTGPQVNFSPGRETKIGSGTGHPNGITLDGSGNVYIADWDNGRVVKETWSAGSYTQSTVASGLDFVAGLAMDGAGNLYIADYGKNQVLKETLSAGSYTESVVASGLYDPNGVAVDALGNVYIADALNGRVLKETLSGASYAQTDILDCGSVGSQSCPSSVAVDGSGNLFITSYTSSQILELKPSTSGYTQSSIGNGFNWASGITVDDLGNIYVADTLNNQIVKETLSEGSYTQSVVSSSSLYWPWGVAVDGNGNVYINDSYNSRVLKENLADAPTLTFKQTPVGTTSSDSPQAVTVKNIGNAPLSFPVPSSGTNPSISANFTLDSSESSACPLVSAGESAAGTLAADATCLLPISYSPTKATPVTGTLTLTDNNLNAASPSWAKQTIALSGAVGRTTPQFTVAISPANGIAQLGQPFTITVTASGPKGDPVPTGSVTLAGTNNYNNFPNQTIQLNSAGVASWTSSSLADGFYEVNVTYAGDTDYLPSAPVYEQFTILGPPVSMNLQFDSSYGLEYGESSPLLVQVLDSARDPLSGETVNCSSSGFSFLKGTIVTAYGSAWFYLVPQTVGNQSVTCAVSGTSVSATASIEVIPSGLVVTVSSSPSAMIYGSFSPPHFTIKSVDGLLNGDTLGGTVIVSSVATTATAQSGVGVYPAAVTLSGSSAADYAPIVMGGSVDIVHAPLTLTAKNVDVLYGHSPALPLEYKLSGFVNGDTASVVTGAPILSTTVTPTTPRGTYPISVQVGTLTAQNYKFVVEATGSVGVIKAPLTVTANSVTMTEGGTVPPLTYTITGFVNGENASVVSGTATLTTSVTSSTTVGEYPITVNISGLSAENYYFVPAVHGGVVKVSK